MSVKEVPADEVYDRAMRIQYALKACEGISTKDLKDGNYIVIKKEKT